MAKDLAKFVKDMVTNIAPETRKDFYRASAVPAEGLPPHNRDCLVCFLPLQDPSHRAGLAVAEIARMCLKRVALCCVSQSELDFASTS